jgi:butyryl-CoA dehydrogenase
MIGYRGYLESLDYARERPQGRLPSNRDPSSPPVKLIEHADVRRMLLAQKAIAEGGLALCLYASRIVDDLETVVEKDEKEALKALLDLLTPVVKAWPSEYGPKANDLAIQVLGGSGYTRDYPVEQCYRDNRLNPIHEGTNGIQALDLLGRKLWQKNSLGLTTLMGRIDTTIAQASVFVELEDLSRTLKAAVKTCTGTTLFLGQALQKYGPDLVLANAALYLDMFGKVIVSWLWLQQAAVAQDKLNNGQGDRNFLQGKIQCARYYINRELPGIQHQADLLKQLEPTCFEMKNEWY